MLTLLIFYLLKVCSSINQIKPLVIIQVYIKKNILGNLKRYDDLKCFFQQYGKILDITIPLDYYSGMPKGYCFIEYPFL